MSQLEILPMIMREMNNRHITPADLARGLNRKPASINGMLKRPTIQVQKLAELSELLQYNFFREIAARLPYTEPVDRQSEAALLRDRVKELEQEVGILRQIIKDWGKG